MWYVQPVEDNHVDALLREHYDKDLQDDGYIANTSRAFSHHPEMIVVWKQMVKTIRSRLRLRTYELVTLASARAMGCVYCMLAHGSVLHRNGFTAPQIIQMLEDYHKAEITPVEVHLMDFATKLTQEPNAISQADIDVLRQDGLNEQQITDVTLASAARNFISRLFDAVGARADEELKAREPELWDYLKDWETVKAD